MDIQISEIEYCKVSIKYQGDPEDVKKKRQFVAREMAKTWEVKGFRKGKSSPEVIKITYPKEVDAHLRQEMLRKAYQDSLNEKNIKAFGGPEVVSSKLEGNVFEAEFAVHTMPEFELKNYKGFEIPKYPSPMTVDDLSQKILQEFREQHADTVPYAEGDFVQMKDKIVVNYEAFEGDMKLEDLSAEGTILEVGKINLQGFDDEILGMKPNEERSFVLHTPKDFVTEFADKNIRFVVKLISGSKLVPAALDDELAKKGGGETFADLEKEAKTLASNRLAEAAENHYRDQVGNRLIVEHDFVVPEWIASPEAQVQAEMRKLNWKELSEEEQTKMKEEASEAIKLSLVLSKIQEEEPAAALTEEELLQKARENFSQFTANPNEVLETVAKKGQLGMLLTRVKDEHTLSYIVKQSTIIE